MLFSDRPARSFKPGLKALRQVLEHDPRQIDDYGQRPFGVLIYEPEQEFALSAALEAMQGELAEQDRVIRLLSFGELLKAVLDRSLAEQGGTWEELYQLERDFGQAELGFGLATLLDSALAETIVNQVQDLRPERDALILTRAGLLYPHYRVNPLLEALGNFDHMKVATVLCYPGRREGETGLSFMGEQDVLRGYRQRIF